MLTGAPYFATDHDDVSADELWDYIDSKIMANWVVSAASHQGTGNDTD